MSEPPIPPPDATAAVVQFQELVRLLYAAASLTVQLADAVGLEPDEPVIFQGPHPTRGVRLTLERKSFLIPGTGSGPVPRNLRGG